MSKEYNDSSFITLAADLIHPGHINIIKIAGEYSQKIIVGLYSDKAIASYDRLPVLTFEDRKKIVLEFKNVAEVIQLDSLDFSNVINELKPKYVIHGDDWKSNYMKEIRERVIQVVNGYNGTIIEPAYTPGYSSSNINLEMRQKLNTPNYRLKQLRRLLENKNVIRVLEAHNGLTGLIVEKTHIMEDGKKLEFDAIWESSLTDSTSKGKPDNGSVDISDRIQTINQILEVTTKPIIVDADNGGLMEHFVYTVKSLERLGVSAVIIEDKIGLKQNSLFGTEVPQTQDTVENFSRKITSGKKAQITDDFMIIARIESLILKQGLKDALTRAKAYIDAGADGIMIHSKNKSPNEIIEFCKEYKKFQIRKPLVVVPSTYGTITEDELQANGVNIVIYANQLLRSSYPAMVNVAETILKNKKASSVDEQCMNIKEIIRLIPQESLQ